MPSAEEINAYLERSAARTRLRLPLAKGAAAVVPPAGARSAEGPLQSPAAPKKLPVQGSAARSALPRGAAPQPPAPDANASGEAPGDVEDESGWRPFPEGGER